MLSIMSFALKHHIASATEQKSKTFCKDEHTLSFIMSIADKLPAHWPILHHSDPGACHRIPPDSAHQILDEVVLSIGGDGHHVAVVCQTDVSGFLERSSGTCHSVTKALELFPTVRARELHLWERA